MKNKTHQGFSIIELLIAISIMGVMSALTTAVIVATIRFYAFTNNFRQNQQAGRNIMDTIASDTRFGELTAPSPGASIAGIKLCVKFRGEMTITYFLDSNYDLIRAMDPANGQYACQTNGQAGTWGLTKLNPPNMQVAQFKVTRIEAPSPAAGNATSAKIQLNFITGNGISTASGLVCAANNIYCSQSTLITAISLDEDL